MAVFSLLLYNLSILPMKMGSENRVQLISAQLIYLFMPIQPIWTHFSGQWDQLNSFEPRFFSTREWSKMGHNFMSCHYFFLVEYILIHFWLNCYEHLLRTFALPDKFSYGGFSNSHWKMVVWFFFNYQLRFSSLSWELEWLTQ